MNDIIRHIVGLIKAIDKIVPNFKSQIIRALQEF